MSYRLHPTKNKNLKAGEQKWYQIEIGYGDNRETKVLQFPSERAAQLYDNDMKRAHRPSAATLIAPSFEQMLPEFLESYALDHLPRTVESWLQAWNNLAPHFGKLKPNHLTQPLIDQYKITRLSQKAGIRSNLVCKRTVEKELNCLSRFIRYGVENSYCEPLTFKIKRFPKNQTKPQKQLSIPAPNQIEAMLAACRVDSRPLYQLIYYTGLRSEEIRTIKLRHVDFQSKLISIEGKGGKYRIIPIVPQALPVLKKLAEKKELDDFLLISNKTGKPYTASIGHLSAACEKAGITQHITAHTLRHCFATHCCMWGMSTRAVQMLLGHASITTTQIYQTLAATFITEEMSRFGGTPKETGNKEEVNQ